MSLDLFHALTTLLDTLERARPSHDAHTPLFPHGVVCTWVDGAPRVLERRRAAWATPPTTSAHAAIAKEHARLDLESRWTAFLNQMRPIPALADVAPLFHLVIDTPKAFTHVLSTEAINAWAPTTTHGIAPTTHGIAQVWGVLGQASASSWEQTNRFGFFDTRDRSWIGDCTTTPTAARLLAPAFAVVSNSAIRVAQWVGAFPAPTPRSTEPWAPEADRDWPTGPGWEALARHHRVLATHERYGKDIVSLDDGDDGPQGFVALANAGDPMGMEAQDWATMDDDAAKITWWTTLDQAWRGFWREAEAIAPIVRRQPGDPTRHHNPMTRAEDGERIGIACLGGTLWHPADLADVAHLPTGPCWWVRCPVDSHTVLWVRTDTVHHAVAAAGVFLMESCPRGGMLEVWQPIPEP